MKTKRLFQLLLGLLIIILSMWGIIAFLAYFPNSIEYTHNLLLKEKNPFIHEFLRFTPAMFFFTGIFVMGVVIHKGVKLFGNKKVIK